MALIEIRKAGFVNKGAELMHHAILQRISGEYPDVKFTMAPNYSVAPFEKRIALGHYQKLWHNFHGFQLGYMGALIPKRLRTMYGVVLDRDVDIVLDAAGFAYSSQFGDDNTIKLANACKRWRHQGTKVVLLPQAFGPFTTKKIKNSIKVVADNTDLIFARDPISYHHLTSVVGKRHHIKIAPDFTNLVKGIIPSNFKKKTDSFCVVPNYRMIDMTYPEESTAYVPFIVTCIKYLQTHGANPFILIHEGENDLMLAQQINRSLREKIQIIKEVDPIKIKGILGTCYATLGSRFHGLVSALSQGVPALGTGWSHKYEMLFKDYAFTEGLISLTAKEDEIVQKIDLLLNKKEYSEIKQTIQNNSNKHKTLSEKMWQDVIQLLNSTKLI